MKIKAEIQKELFRVLDTQKDFCKSGDAEQRAYYDGMRRMLEMVLTDFYRIPGAICADTCPKYPGGPRHAFVTATQFVKKEESAK